MVSALVLLAALATCYGLATGQPLAEGEFWSHCETLDPNLPSTVHQPAGLEFGWIARPDELWPCNWRWHN